MEKEKIAYKVSGPASAYLNQKQLERYEIKYLNYCRIQIEKINTSRDINAETFEVIAKRFISPFNFWIQNQIVLKNLNENKNDTKTRY